ncbi:Helix-turn-helix domain-containing protein [Micromonospora matsumotoense]|uniref:Helix-turn-helix domain-containing protein n=1 Tax=Micromonospora matsumotoense TaxID=121616 RepID=A0A1C4Y4P7_9ACTN|nr:Helix-turn-helix domain-containing protein [Micromonospora matsumotoense]
MLDYQVTLGDEIVAARQRAHLTQEELAARTGLSVRSIRNLESARVLRPRPATVRLIRDALGLPGPSSPPHRPRPMQLPLDVPGFTGRVVQLAQLDRLFDGGPRRMSTVVVCALVGRPGIGKTALALHWAHRFAARFADGVLHVDLGGNRARRSPTSPSDVLGCLIEALAVPAGGIPRGLDARVGLYRSLLAGRRMLIVLDDAWDADQVRPLLPGVAGCMVLVTSRDWLTGLVAGEVAHPVVLDRLAPEEAYELLRARLGAHRLAAEPEAVGGIVAHCQGVPRALAMVAARAAVQPGVSLTELARQLR